MKQFFPVLMASVAFLFIGCKKEFLPPMTRIEMVRLIADHSGIEKHPKAKNLCAKRFSDTKKQDQCKLEILFYLNAIDYYGGNHRALKFAPDKNVTWAQFTKAFKIIFGQEIKFNKRKIKQPVSYRMGTTLIMGAIKNKIALKSALDSAFAQAEEIFQVHGWLVQQSARCLSQGCQIMVRETKVR